MGCGAKRWKLPEEHRKAPGRLVLPLSAFCKDVVMRRVAKERQPPGVTMWTLAAFTSNSSVPFFSLAAFRSGYHLPHFTRSITDRTLLPHSHFLGRLPQDPATIVPLSWDHQTFRGSGRSAESFSAYSWMGGWKKTGLVCHRRPSCVCAAAFSFLDEWKSRVTHSAHAHVPPNTGPCELKPKAVSQRHSRGWFHLLTRKRSKCQRSGKVKCRLKR